MAFHGFSLVFHAINHGNFPHPMAMAPRRLRLPRWTPQQATEVTSQGGEQGEGAPARAGHLGGFRRNLREKHLGVNTHTMWGPPVMLVGL